MSAIAIEFVVILVLIVANGLFSMAEIALVSARKSRLRKLAADGEMMTPRARINWLKLAAGDAAAPAHTL